MIESSYDMNDLQDILIPDNTKKMIKARIPEVYSPHQFYVYNEVELRSLLNSNFFQFELKIDKVGRVECLADDFSIFLDIYCAINFLKQ